MSLSCFFNPHHGCLLHADGHGEVWADWNSTSKFFQYGWRCTTNEDSFSNKTLLGNWNQERYDIRRVLQPKPLPSQFSHYFESTYSSDYSKEMPHSTRSRCPKLKHRQRTRRELHENLTGFLGTSQNWSLLQSSQLLGHAT
ncbi:uncharacterized protein CFAP68 isoform X2 [Eublepharis macularius]|uniref:Uncharacterized protein CFAP68 isoform X2 n=1 Tax=Eublepharis macularius TaxID=481883 RepID=A0AA97KFB8_EUBMA|nr:uncharacterized protein CFAP68 isoform X2 [Eublepharis macularius]